MSQTEFHVSCQAATPFLTTPFLSFLSYVPEKLLSYLRASPFTFTASLTEVQRLLEVVKRHKEGWWDRLPRPGNELHALIPFSYPIYEVQANSVGQLEPTVAGKVAKLYGYVQFLNSLQAARETNIAANQFPAFDKLYTDSLKNFLENFGTQLDDHFREVGLRK